MKSDHDRCVHNEHDITYLRELLAAEIRRLDGILEERERRMEMALASITTSGEKAEAESLRARQAANEWRSTMADRENRFATVASMETMDKELGNVRNAISEWQGRRVAWIAAAGIIATLMAIGIGQIIRQGITSADVSNQIQREAPWNMDKSEVERRLATLERQIDALRIRDATAEQRINNICAAHSPRIRPC